MRRAALLLLLAACGHDPLRLQPTPVVVGYDNEDVLDAAPLPHYDNDGDADLVVALPSGLRFLLRDGNGWRDETPSTALDHAGPARALRADGADLLVERPDGTLARLQSSGIGSWHAGGGGIL